MNRSLPHDAICFFKDGNKWCCVNGDFVNLQESPAGFGDTFEDALMQLRGRIDEMRPLTKPADRNQS